MSISRRRVGSGRSARRALPRICPWPCGTGGGCPHAPPISVRTLGRRASPATSWPSLLAACRILSLRHRHPLPFRLTRSGRRALPRARRRPLSPTRQGSRGRANGTRAAAANPTRSGAACMSRVGPGPRLAALGCPSNLPLPPPQPGRMSAQAVSLMSGELEAFSGRTDVAVAPKETRLAEQLHHFSYAVLCVFFSADPRTRVMRLFRLLLRCFCLDRRSCGP